MIQNTNKVRAINGGRSQQADKEHWVNTVLVFASYLMHAAIVVQTAILACDNTFEPIALSVSNIRKRKALI